MKWLKIKCWLVLVALLCTVSGCSESDMEATSPQQGSVEPAPSQSEPPASVSMKQESEPPAETDGTDVAGAVPTPEPSETPEPVIAGLLGKGESVEDEWFADAVFVGDSRTDGLRLYSGIKSPTFISHQGLSVFNIDSKECIDVGGTKVTALAALEQQQWAKVYLMLGVNELGYGSAAFREAYTGVVEQIKAIQPDATIYIQTILPVNEGIAKTKGISSAINNERVVIFNNIIAEIAESEETALVDVAANFWSEAGEMAPENTSDGVHLTRQGYVSWYEYLKSHTGDTEQLEAPPAHIYVPGSAEPPAEPGPEGSGQPGEPSDSPSPEQSSETQQSGETEHSGTEEPGEDGRPETEMETSAPPAESPGEGTAELSFGAQQGQ